MKVGIMPLFGGDTAKPAYVARIARHLEERGFHPVWAVDHSLLPITFKSRYPYSADGAFPVDSRLQGLEPFNVLSFIAALTSRIRLGTGVLVVPQRNPALTAKQVADLDVLSNGRFDFGVEVGSLAEEFEALGESFERRGARNDDYLPLMQALWRVARFGHRFELDLLPEDLPAKKAELARQCAAHGRNVDDVKIALCPYAKPCTRDTLKRYEDVGVDQVIMAAFVPGQDAILRALDTLADALP